MRNGRAIREATTSGLPQGKLLGHQLAQHQRQVGGDEHDDQQRQLGRGGLQQGDACQHRFEPRGEAGAADRAGEDADQRHSDLHRGQETLRILRERQGRGGAGDALALQHHQAGPADGHQGQFAQREHAIQEDEKQSEEDYEAGSHGSSYRTGRGRCHYTPMQRSLPPLALLLGIAGLIPFALCGYLALTDRGDPAAMALAAYGAVILAFLGGVHWGFALLEPSGRAERLRLGLGVVPSLVGWVALLLVIAVNVETGLAMLLVGFVVTTVVEARAGKAGLVPSGYRTLRYGLTATVVTILVLVVLLRLFHVHVAGWQL